MKKITLLMAAALCLLLASCASTSAASEPLDQGFYPAGEEAEASVEIIVASNLIITGIDDKADTFATGVSGWKNKKNARQKQLFRLSPGVHTISVKFNDGSRYTLFSNVMIVNLVEGNQYNITYSIDGNSVLYDCVNADTLESAKLDNEALSGTGETVVAGFIDAVLKPTMDDVGQTVIQENDDYIITTYPGLMFEITDKKTGATEKGMRTFVTDFSFKSGTVYYCITDMTDKNEFLNSDYKNNSQYIFTVTACDRKTVTYTYQKPDDKAGQTVTFNISVKE